MPKSLYLAAASLFLSLPLTAQTMPSAEGTGITLWMGASVSMFNPDYGCSSSSPFSCWGHQLIGLGPYANTSPFFFGRIGAEAQAHFLLWNGPASLTEHSYMAGPLVRIYSFHELRFNGKFLLGAGHFSLPSNSIENGTYFAFAPGGTIDYRFAKRLSARLDYEYQTWPSFKSSVTGHSGLTPNGFSLGIGYALR